MARARTGASSHALLRRRQRWRRERGFRSAVRSQVAAFRDVHGVSQLGGRCPVSGEVLTRENLHIDHERAFDELMHAFLRDEGLPPRDVRVKPTVDASTETELADALLLVRWQEIR